LARVRGGAEDKAGRRRDPPHLPSAIAMYLHSAVSVHAEPLLAPAQGRPQPPGVRLCRRLCAVVRLWWALTVSPRALKVPWSRRGAWRAVLVVLAVVEVTQDWAAGFGADMLLCDLVCTLAGAALLGRVVRESWTSDVIMVTAWVMPAFYVWQFRPPPLSSPLACSNCLAFLTVFLGLVGVRSIAVGAASLLMGFYLYKFEPDVHFSNKRRCFGQMILSNVIIAVIEYLLAELSERSRRETLAKKRLLDASTGGSFTLDFDGCICDASEGLVSTFGGSNLQGRALADFLVRREDQARVEALVRSLGEVEAHAFAASDENLCDPFVATFRVSRCSGAPGEQAEFDARVAPYQTSGVSLHACIHIIGEVRPCHAEGAATAAPDRPNDASIEFNIFDPTQLITKVSARWEEMFGPVAQRACVADVLPGRDGQGLIRILQASVNSEFYQRGYHRRHTVAVQLADFALQDTGGRRVVLRACALLPPFAADFLPGQPFTVTLSLRRLPGGQATNPTIPPPPSTVFSSSSSSSSSTDRGGPRRMSLRKSRGSGASVGRETPAHSIAEELPSRPAPAPQPLPSRPAARGGGAAAATTPLPLPWQPAASTAAPQPPPSRPAASVAEPVPAAPQPPPPQPAASAADPFSTGPQPPPPQPAAGGGGAAAGTTVPTTLQLSALMWPWRSTPRRFMQAHIYVLARACSVRPQDGGVGSACGGACNWHRALHAISRRAQEMLALECVKDPQEGHFVQCRRCCLVRSARLPECHSCATIDSEV